MIVFGERNLPVPLWLWIGVPIAFLAYKAGDTWLLTHRSWSPDRDYLFFVRTLAVGSVSGFALADIARRGRMPWYFLPVLFLGSIVGIGLLVDWVASSQTVVAGSLAALAIGAANGRGSGGVGMLWVFMAAGPLLFAFMCAFALTAATRILLGLPLLSRDGCRELLANVLSAFVWFALGLGGYLAIRSFWGLALGHPATAVPGWLPYMAGVAAAAVATAFQLLLAGVIGRGEATMGNGRWLLVVATLCAIVFWFRPYAFGSPGVRTYVALLPVIRAAHLTPGWNFPESRLPHRPLSPGHR